MLEHVMVEVFFQSMLTLMKKEFPMRLVTTTRLKIKTVNHLTNVEHVQPSDNVTLSAITPNFMYPNTVRTHYDKNEYFKKILCIHVCISYMYLWVRGIVVHNLEFKFQQAP